MEETPQAFLSHAVTGRLRISIPGKRGDRAYFDSLERSLAAAPDVIRISARPMTGNVVLLHTGEPVMIAAFAREQNLFDMSESEPPLEPVAARLRGAAAAADSRIRQWAGGGLDLPTVVSLVLVFAALMQVRQGRFLGPASSLLWTAVSALRAARSDPSEKD